ncbi:hypothetical protein BDN72DRAFT_796685 [Pluteus cervinus]|uniref:Uncharacterized protein n=1 Tax=Pluteus cervinus TaxID=181527 RepID=A0ACD3AU09_9AGAR|nr:hypothetical protein BDN72DRAFT_796685 [Pluteus cervinus]
MSTGELSQTTYATRRKDLLAVIDQLRANGSQDELDLPKIAVIGNQSAGKSSIVEAISGISVPRDGGTCTRCAYECRLSPAAEWSCVIKLRREFDASGARLKTGVCEVPFGSVIKNKEEVESRLRRAQVAILSGPTRDTQALVMSPDQVKLFQEEISGHTQGKSTNPIRVNDIPRFSNNTVCVHLQGPEYTDLAFVDLPGLIAAEDRETVQLVEDIVLSRIQGNCLILLALPMSDDMMNQKALQLARRVDPKGERTIGVLTKPDMLTSGSLDAHDFWVKVLSGAGPYPLERGYFCSKQPDDQQRRSGITPAVARKAEQDFFAKVESWSKIADTQIAVGVRMRDRYGLPRLVASLSDSLIEIIGQSLPRLQTSAERLLKQSQVELAKLPRAPSSEPFAEVLQLVTSFCADIVTSVQSSTALSLHQWTDASQMTFQNLIASGRSDPNRLIHENRAAFSRFREHIHRTRPRFHPYTKKDRTKYKVKNIDGDEEHQQDQEMADGSGEIQPAAMDLDDVKTYIESSTTRELPGNVPYTAKVALITSVQTSWPQSVHACADAVRNSLLQTLHECAEHRFKSFPTLHRLIRAAFAELVEKRFDSCLVMLQAILETEQSPFTQNGHYLESSTDAWLSRYKEARVQVHTLPPAPVAFKNGFATYTSPPTSASFRFDLDTSGANKGPAAPSTPPSSSSPNPQQAQQSGLFTFGKASTSTTTPTASSSQQQVSKAQTTPQAVQPANGGRAQAPASPAPVATPKPASKAQEVAGEAREEILNRALATLAELGYRNITEEDLVRLNPPDEYETEMRVMAEVRGYFKVSFKRVIDIIPSLIDLKFVRAVADDMQTFLVETLALGGGNAGEKCAGYLEQDPAVKTRREELTAVVKRMQSAQIELLRLGA